MSALKQQLKRIIRRVTPDPLWITWESRASRNTQMKYLRNEGFLDIGKRFVDQHGTQVLHGPFAGMRYPMESTRSRHIVPRLAGTYEMELHSIFESMSKTYDCVVDIGSAEGYYAVGLALRLGVPVHAFSSQPWQNGKATRYF